MNVCLCQAGRVGAFCLTFGLYWILAWLGVSYTEAHLFDMDHGATIVPVVIAGLGALGVLGGIREALSHDDGINEASVAWSVWLGGLAGWALWHGWFLDGKAWGFHLSRAFWLALLASEVFNLWLNFRGVLRRSRPAQSPNINSILSDDPKPLARHRLRRSRTIKVVEVIEGDRESLAHHLGSNTPYYAPPHASPLIGSDGRPVPQLLYVKDEATGEFIPVQLPHDERVPVNRRIR
jgi:hypothetical protein